MSDNRVHASAWKTRDHGTVRGDPRKTSVASSLAGPGRNKNKNKRSMADAGFSEPSGMNGYVMRGEVDARRSKVRVLDQRPPLAPLPSQLPSLRPPVHPSMLPHSILPCPMQPFGLPVSEPLPASSSVSMLMNNGFIRPVQGFQQHAPLPMFPAAPSRPPPFGVQNLLSSLIAQGLISTAANTDVAIGVEFRQEILRERHDVVINSLYSDIPRQCTTCGLRFKRQEEHTRHMDWHVSRNRRRKSHKKSSGRWFVPLKDWISGAAVEEEAAEAVGSKVVEDDKLEVPADYDQTSCALCREGFDDYYSDEKQMWMYRDAVYMDARPGSSEGMEGTSLGPIAHAKCMPQRPTESTYS